MSQAIKEISRRLKQYPEVPYELQEQSIRVPAKNEKGFDVSLTDHGNGQFLVAYDFWHEEFDHENDALNCFGFGLSSKSRLKLVKKGKRPIKWIVEYDDAGIWKEDSVTGLFSLSFWKKPSIEYLQNDWIQWDSSKKNN